MSFNPQIFGEGFHQFVQMEYSMFGFLSIILHICSLALLVLIFLYGNKFRKVFIVYFTINWLFLLGYWGIFGIVYWSKIGIPYLFAYIFAPILLLLIFINWIKEIKNPKIDLNFIKAKWYKFIVLLILIWGFWYPSYIYDIGFSFTARDFLFSYYGLMPCPTTMFVLSLMTINYPKTNKKLYHLLTAYALFIGTATVMSGWLPDIPFIILGIYAVIVAIANRKNTDAIQ